MHVEAVSRYRFVDKRGRRLGGAFALAVSSFTFSTVPPRVRLSLGVRRAGFRDEVETRVAGRATLEDVVALAELRNMGLLIRPKHRPQWLDRWSTLLPYFAFTSFIDDVNLAPVEAHYRDLIALAGAVRPPAPRREAPRGGFRRPERSPKAAPCGSSHAARRTPLARTASRSSTGK